MIGHSAMGISARGAAKGLILTGLIMAIAACATPETRIRSALVNAGLPTPIAGCMADRMVNELSFGQLQKLQGLSRLHEQDPGDISFTEFARRTRALRDTEILTVVASSGALCTMRDRIGAR